MKRLAIQYGSRRIEFDLERRSVQTLSITVKPDGRVIVVAPLDAEEARVLTRVRRRGRWIVKQWERQALMLPAPPTILLRSGASIRYLGRQYRLRVFLNPEVPAAQVRFCRSTIEVRTATEGESSEAVKGWLRDRAEVILPERFERCSRIAERQGIKGGRLALRAMPKRWGSCLQSGRILINPDLIRMPVDCVDYVILHELCHLKVHSHSPAFYKLLSNVLPEWERIRARLARFS